MDDTFLSGLHGTFVGVILGLGIGFVFFTRWLWWGLYMVILGTFHLLEFVVTGLHNPSKLTHGSFLLDNGVEYAAAMLCSCLEYVIECWWWEEGKEAWPVALLGLCLCLAGQSLRTTAMCTAGESFNHHIDCGLEPHHTLVCSGVYRLVRHPSYAGWLWWAIGTQVMLCNPVCAIGFALVSWRFFSDRIEAEEHDLLQLHGPAYAQYKAVTMSGIPGIP